MFVDCEMKLSTVAAVHRSEKNQKVFAKKGFVHSCIALWSISNTLDI